MKKLLVARVVVGAMLLARRCTLGQGKFSTAKVLDRIPDDSRPRWMFRNISALRGHTDRIMELLERVAPTYRSSRAAGQATT